MTTSYQQLQTIQVGDEIVLTDGYVFNPYWLHKVEKVTKTQLTVDNKRFMKSTGDIVGGSDWLSKSDIYIAKDFNAGKLLTWEDAEEANQKQLDRKKCQDLISQVEKKVRDLRNCSDVKGLEFVLEALNEVK